MIPLAQAHRILDGTEVVSAGDGPVVALAHGAGGSIADNFGPLMGGGPRHRLTGPNYPGAGGTPRADEPLELELLADRVVAAGVAAGGDRFPIVGLSLGAAVAVTAAVRHPEHVDALVLTVGLARHDAQSRSFVAVCRALAAAGDLAAWAQHALASAAGPAELTAVGEAEQTAMVADLARTHRPGTADHHELVLRTDVTPLLAQVDVPTLVVVGGQDRIVLPDTVRELGAIRGSTVVEYPDAGHIFDPVQGARWAEDVLDFLDRSEHAA